MFEPEQGVGEKTGFPDGERDQLGMKWREDALMLIPFARTFRQKVPALTRGRLTSGAGHAI